MHGPVFAWTPLGHWWCAEQMLTVRGVDGRDQLAADGGDATVLMLKGTELEAAFAKDGTLPDPEHHDPSVYMRRPVGHGFYLYGCHHLDENGKVQQGCQ